jgi:hypothetical protein
MPDTAIFDPEKEGRPMRVAAFMSGSGTNIIKLIEHEKRLAAKEGISPFHVVFIFSDRSDGTCAGEKIALDNGLPYISYDTRAFHRLRSLKRSVMTSEGLAARKEFDSGALMFILPIYRFVCLTVGEDMWETSLFRTLSGLGKGRFVHPPYGLMKGLTPGRC